MVGVEGDEISYELFVYIDIFSNSENIKWKNMMKLLIKYILQRSIKPYIYLTRG